MDIDGIKHGYWWDKTWIQHGLDTIWILIGCNLDMGKKAFINFKMFEYFGLNTRIIKKK